MMPDIQEIQRAARLLEQGKLVAFPTETVYGLGADASTPEAIAAIFTAKGRPSIILPSDLGALRCCLATPFAELH